MNLTHASTEELTVAFALDARAYLAQFEQAVRESAAGVDALQGFGHAGEALRGIRIGAEFLGLDAIRQACRRGEQELLLQLPAISAGEPAHAAPLQVIVGELRARLDALGGMVPATPPRAAEAPQHDVPALPEAAPEPEIEVVWIDDEPDDVPPPPAPAHEAHEVQAAAPVAVPQVPAPVAAALDGATMTALLQRLDEIPALLREQIDAWRELRAEAQPKAAPEAARAAEPEVRPVPAEALPAGDADAIEVHLARVGRWIVALPTADVLAVLPHGAPGTRLPQGGPLLFTDAGAVPAVSLAGDWEPAQHDDGGVVVLDHAGHPLALRVDDCLPPQTLRFDPLPRAIGGRHGIAAAAVLPHLDGQRAALLLDAGHLRGLLGGGAWR